MDGRRMDIIVDYANEQFIIELKIWRGEAYRENAHAQLLGYMEAKKMTQGYLVIFDVRQDRNKELGACWLDIDGKQIFEAVM